MDQQTVDPPSVLWIIARNNSQTDGWTDRSIVECVRSVSSCVSARTSIVVISVTAAQTRSHPPGQSWSGIRTGDPVRFCLCYTL